jgi:hypothetical protein
MDVPLIKYVDDMMLAFASPEVCTWFESSMKQWYELVIQDMNITYLGMSKMLRLKSATRSDKS